MEKGDREMTFAQLLEKVITQTYNVFCPLKIDLGDGSLYKEVSEVTIDRGFIILELEKEKEK
jgi:hypothetical protein